MLCIVVKQYVYRQRCLKKRLSPVEFSRYFFNFKNVEKYYAIKQNKLAKYMRKWNESIPEEVLSQMTHEHVEV